MNTTEICRKIFKFKYILDEEQPNKNNLPTLVCLYWKNNRKHRMQLTDKQVFKQIDKNKLVYTYLQMY